MAASAISNSLLSSPSPRPPPPHRPTFAWSPSRSQVNLRSTAVRSYPTLFTTRSSLDAANDTKQDTPIELSTYFASKISLFLFLFLLIGLVSIFFFFLQDMLHFLQWWISIRFVKFCLTGQFHFFLCNIFEKFSFLCTLNHCLRKTHFAICFSVSFF